MKQNIQISPSGISFIDSSWGGLYKSGTYLVVGAHKSGRTTLALEYLRQCLENNELCIYFTTRRPKELILQAASLNIDLQFHISQNSVIVIRVESSISLNEKREPDFVLSEYIKDIVEVVQEYQPSKVIFDEITPFIGFQNHQLLEETFTEAFESIEDTGSTSLLIIGDPITASAKKIVNILANHSTGIFYLQKTLSASESNVVQGIFSITPNVGHTEGKFRSKYKLVPGKGFHFEDSESSMQKNELKPKTTNSEFRYKPLVELSTGKDKYRVSNEYNYQDFVLLVNNQIAFYKSTGQKFSLVSFRLDPSVEREQFFSLNHLKNAVRLSLDRKDKFCAVGNKVVVLLIKEEQNDINKLIANVKSNLCAEDSPILSKLLSAISVYTATVNETISTSEQMLKEIRNDELSGKINSKFL